MRPFSHGNRGFTLIELVVAVSIVAILAAIAYPSYIRFTRQSNRTDATRTMAQDAQALQRCYSQNFTYLPAGGCQPAAGATASPGGYYSINIDIADATTYTITAMPSAGSMQAQDTQCAKMILTSSGQQTAQDSGGGDTTKTCWGSN